MCFLFRIILKPFVLMKATCTASFQCTPSIFPLKTETITVLQISTATIVLSQIISSHSCTQVGSPVTETQAITVSHVSTATVVVSQTPNNIFLSETSKYAGSQSAWMVAAILFIIISILAVILSLILGYLLFKKDKIPEKPNTSSSSQQHRKPLPECEPRSYV